MAKIATLELKNGSKKNTVSSREDEQAQIANLAYQFFVDRGCQHGYDAEDWLRAETLIKNKKR